VIAQRKQGNVVVTMERLMAQLPQLVEVGAVGLHAKSDGTFDIVTTARLMPLVLMVVDGGRVL